MSKVYRVICPVCGFKKWSYEMRKRWDGIYVCQPDWEPRHPSDFFNVKPEDPSLPYSYPDAPIGTVCSAIGVFAIAGVGTAGCMIAGYADGYRGTGGSGSGGTL